MTAHKLAIVQNVAQAPDDCEVDYGRACPVIPPGIYRAILTHHETAFVFKTPKVFLWFRIVDPGNCFERELYAVNRVKQLKGRARKNGAFVVGARSDLFRIACHVLDLNMRPKRFSIYGLRNRVLRVMVSTVTHDYKQRPLPIAMQYSKVSEILGTETGC